MEEKLYSPEVINVIRYPKYPTVNSEIRIYANIVDKYGQIENSTLSFSFDEINYSNQIPMKLVNGTPSNGTYLGIIKPSSKNSENSTLHYKIYIGDNLGYQFNSEYEQLKLKARDVLKPIITDNPFFMVCPTEKPNYSESVLSSLIMLDNLHKCITLRENMPRPESPLFFKIDIYEPDPSHGTGIKNATLFYSTGSPPNSKFISKDLTILQYPPFYYRNSAVGVLPTLFRNASLSYYVEVYDYAGNKAVSKNFTLPYLANSCLPVEYCSKPRQNSTTANLVINRIDDNNLAAWTTIDLEIAESTRFNSYSTFFEEKRPPIMVLGLNNLKELVNGFENRTFIGEGGDRFNSASEGINDILYPAKASGVLNFVGDPSLYPFDQYYINLVIAIPVENATFDGAIINDEINWGIVKYVDQAKSLWQVTHSRIAKIKSNNSTSTIGSLDLCGNDKMIFDKELVSFCGVKSNYQGYGPTYLNVKIDIARNYKIATIIITLFSIFFLLGAIFIFENSSDGIGNRLALALGIFALIFTLPDIINQAKPEASGPTIADSLLSIIILSTIAFTISSVMSSSSVFQSWFPKRYSWFDGIVFISMSGFVIYYFKPYTFDTNLWWLVPILVFGLGYGLLLRILGIKISQPLWRMSLFRRTK